MYKKNGYYLKYIHPYAAKLEEVFLISGKQGYLLHLLQDLSGNFSLIPYSSFTEFTLLVEELIVRNLL